MRLPGFTGRLAWFVQAMLVLAGFIYVLHATVHSWPTAVFMGGFIAVLGTEARMIYLVRVRKDRTARWPLVIAAAGVFAAVFMMSRDPRSPSSPLAAPTSPPQWQHGAC